MNIRSHATLLGLTLALSLVIQTEHSAWGASATVDVLGIASANYVQTNDAPAHSSELSFEGEEDVLVSPREETNSSEADYGLEDDTVLASSAAAGNDDLLDVDDKIDSIVCCCGGSMCWLEVSCPPGTTEVTCPCMPTICLEPNSPDPPTPQ